MGEKHKDKVVLVTGGARGLGRLATVTALEGVLNM